MRVYEEYYGRPINRHWVFHNLRDAWLVYRIRSPKASDIIILAAFDNEDEWMEFDKYLPYNGDIICFSYCDPSKSAILTE